VPYPIDNALFQWEDGWRALQALGGDQRVQRRAEAAVDAIRDELRLRIGATFNVADLADLYGEGTDWCLAIAAEVAPGADGRALAAPPPTSPAVAPPAPRLIALRGAPAADAATLRPYRG
jgi:hypothetical protein